MPRKLLCQFCDRKFDLQFDLDRHTRALHRKAERMVKALRAALEPFGAHGDYLDAKGQCASFHDGYILSESAEATVTLGHCRHASRTLFETGPNFKKTL